MENYDPDVAIEKLPVLPVSVDTKALARKIKERQKFLEGAIRFAVGICVRRGKSLFHEMHSCHCHDINELKDFGGFSFWTEGSYTMFGGECVKIWDGTTLVLEVEWWDTKNLKVKCFDEKLPWQRGLTILMRNEARIVARGERREKKAAEICKKQFDTAAEEQRIQQEAERLGL